LSLRFVLNERIIDIPETWICTSFENISSTKNHSMSSGPFGSMLGTKDYRDIGVPVIRGQNIQQGEFIKKNFVYVSEEKALELRRSMAYPGDIVIVAVGVGVGQAAIVPNEIPRSILSQNCNKFTVMRVLLNQSLSYCFFKSRFLNRKCKKGLMILPASS
jgi:type I restriction enzyme, S subunit